MSNDELREQQGQGRTDLHQSSHDETSAPVEQAPAAETAVVRTDDQVILSETSRATAWKKPPDSTMVVETNRIRTPEAGPAPAAVVVLSDDRNGRRDREYEERDRGQEAHGSGHDQDRPSMTRLLLASGLVALVCGIAGAWGYSYFFAPDHEKTAGADADKKSSDNDKSGAGSGTASKEKSGSESKSEDSGAMASTGKAIPGFTRASDADTLKKQIEHLAERIDQLSRRVDKVSQPRHETPPDVRTLQNKVGDLARTVESMGDLPAKFRRFEDRLEDIQQQVKSLRTQLPTSKGGDDAGSSDSDSNSNAKAKSSGRASNGRSSGAHPSIAPASLATDTPSYKVADAPDAALAQGITLFQAGKYAEAWSIFRKLELTRPGDARVWYYSALARGLTTRAWGEETRHLVEKGAERERAGTPSAALIDAAVAGLTRAQGGDWLAAYRKQLVKDR